MAQGKQTPAAAAQAKVYRDACEIAYRKGGKAALQRLSDGWVCDEDLVLLEALHILSKNAGRLQITAREIALQNIPSQIPGRKNKAGKIEERVQIFCTLPSIQTASGVVVYQNGRLILEDGQKPYSGTVRIAPRPFLNGLAPQRRNTKPTNTRATSDSESAKTGLERTFENASDHCEDERTQPIIKLAEERQASYELVIGIENEDRPSYGALNIVTFPDCDSQIIIPVASKRTDLAYKQVRGVLVMKGIKPLSFYESDIYYEKLRANDDVWPLERFTSDKPEVWAAKAFELLAKNKEDMPRQYKHRHNSWGKEGPAIIALLRALVFHFHKHGITQMQTGARTQRIEEFFRLNDIELPANAQSIATRTWNALNGALNKHAKNTCSLHIEGLPLEPVARDNQGNPRPISSITYALNWIHDIMKREGSLELDLSRPEGIPPP